MPHIGTAPARSASPLHALVCALIVALGLLDTAGWLLHSVRMVTLGSGMVAMVFNAGLCFVLCGVALGLTGHTGDGARRLRTALAGATLLLCSATLLEIFRNESLGIDLASLQAWYYQGNASPGRMAPNSARLERLRLSAIRIP